MPTQNPTTIRNMPLASFILAGAHAHPLTMFIDIHTHTQISLYISTDIHIYREMREACIYTYTYPHISFALSPTIQGPTKGHLEPPPGARPPHRGPPLTAARCDPKGAGRAAVLVVRAALPYIFICVYIYMYIPHIYNI